jgi:hypothetical protein
MGDSVVISEVPDCSIGSETTTFQLLNDPIAFETEQTKSIIGFIHEIKSTGFMVTYKWKTYAPIHNLFPSYNGI